jgi:hypothetical protein
VLTTEFGCAQLLSLSTALTLLIDYLMAGFEVIMKFWVIPEVETSNLKKDQSRQVSTIA